MLKKLLWRLALRGGRWLGLYRKFGHPSSKEWATLLRARGDIFHIGEDCWILPSTRFVDPALTWLGDRVQLGNCVLICHDGAIHAIGERHGVRLDRIGAIVIEDEVFVGEDAMIVASGGKVVIGAGSVIGAGAVVRQSVAPGSIVAGNPAKVVGRVQDVLRFWEADTLSFPWNDIIQRRTSGFDPSVEAELNRMRQEHFFGDMSPSRKQGWVRDNEGEID